LPLTCVTLHIYILFLQFSSVAMSDRHSFFIKVVS